MITCNKSVTGDPAYKEGDTIYVISKKKMASARLNVPEDEAQRAAFFKAHADSVLKDDEPNISVMHVKPTGDSEPAGEQSK